VSGSWLYGTANSDSDYDYSTVYDFYNQRYRPKRQSTQKITDDIDLVETTLERFTSLCCKGVPQTVEILFSPAEAWIEENGWLDCSTQIKSELVNHIPAILETYRRTALNFFYSKKNQEKKRRHSFRLLLNAQELKSSGQMHSRLDGDQVAFITELATSFYSEEKFKQMLFEI
jgi:predicted nucleotidyltransferase